MAKKLTGPPDRVPRCTIHGKRRTGCLECRRYSAYDARRRRWERHIGITFQPVPVDLVADHVNMLLNKGNWKIVDIVQASGIPAKTVWGISVRRNPTVYPITAESLLALQPRQQARPPKASMVPATEAVRIARGLAAQGWTFAHISDLMGSSSKSSAQRIAHAHEWVMESTVARLRAVAAQLGPYDITDMDRPMPGMDIRVVRDALSKGWVRLSAWADVDIADPDAVPHVVVADGSQINADEEPEPAPWSYIDPILTLRVAEALDTVRKTDRQAGRRHDGFIAPVGSLTRIEAHAVVEHAFSLGLSTIDIARLLGYPMTTKQKEDNAQRSVERMKSAMRVARHTLGQLDVGAYVDPLWCLRLPNGDGFHQFSSVATALLAVQGEPFGPGWSETELADRAGVGPAAMNAFLAYATRRGDAVWTAHQESQQSPGAQHADAADVVPVDLDLVLAAA